LIDEIIQKHKEAAEHVSAISDDSEELEEKIQEGLRRLDREIAEATTAIQINEWGVIGMWCDGLVNDKPGYKAQILFWENKIAAHQRFLHRAPEIREELERQAAEYAERIKGAVAVEKQLERLKEYRELKDRLREDFSDGDLIELYRLSLDIATFEPELFETDFIPFFIGLKGQYNSESRVLNIPAPDTGDALEVERFRKFWRYEFLRFNLLSKPFSEDMSKGGHLISEMRAIVNDLDRYGPLCRDFGDEFFPQLQNQNREHKISELR
jgi:hypothetical protein